MHKVILVDDELAGRTLIKQYLAAYPEYVVLGEANNGVDAIELINKFKPYLVFLDIQMPGLSGFEVLKHLEELPQIIFSTAYDQYALQAFEVHAVDYLLKPYTQERFKKALQRLDGTKNAARPLTESLLMEQARYPERVLVQAGQKLVTVAVQDIIRIEAFGDYSKLITETATYVSNYGIGALEAKLDPKLFMRVHRSAIINLKSIKELTKYGKSYDVIMKNGEVVRVSRGYMDALKGIMY
jgi:two-component system LytT family response regulator